MLDYNKIKQSLLLCNPYEKTEIEIKFSQFGQPFSSITNVQYERLLKNIYMEKQLSTYFINDNHRKIIITYNSETIKNENYKVIDYIYDNNYQLHFYITQYNENKNNKNNNDYNMIKEKIEYYTFIQDYTLIVSETTIKQETSYEAILKFDIDLLNDNWMNGLDEVLKNIILIINDTNVLYTEIERLELVNNFNNVFNIKNNYIENILNQPFPIQLTNVPINTPYIISTKSKGKRKMLMINKTGIWLVNPPYDYNLLTNVKNRLTDAWSFTVFDGEIIKPLYHNEYEFNYQYWYLAYDCLAFHKDIRNQYYIYRIDICKVFHSILSTYINPNFLKFDLKTTRVAKAQDEYIYQIRYLLSLQENLNYDHNGLIFTPLGQYDNKVYKWSIPSMTTIDFAVYDSGNPESINLYVYDEKTKKDIPFNGTTLQPFDETMIFQEPLVQQYKNKKYIAECKWDEVMEKMVFIKIRDDKNKPDTIDMALENWRNINKEKC